MRQSLNLVWLNKHIPLLSSHVGPPDVTYTSYEFDVVWRNVPRNTALTPAPPPESIPHSPKMRLPNFADDVGGALQCLEHVGGLLAPHGNLVGLVQQRVKVLVLVQLRHQLTLQIVLRDKNMQRTKLVTG